MKKGAYDFLKNMKVVGVIIVSVMFVAGLIVCGHLVAAFYANDLFELGPAQGADILGDGIISNGPDWADLFDADGNPTGNFTAVAESFILDDLSEGGSTDDTTFAGGSNKNNDLITTWNWATGNVPAKDDLSNVYAYAVTDPANGHLIIYSGFERLDPSGDSHIDIEYFQKQIGLDEELPCDNPDTCSFVGERMPGDIIVSMDFLKGGSIGEVTIREWDGSNYVLIETLDGEGCDAAETVCAFNNGGLINGGPWPNFDRHGNIIEELEQNSFSEFGMDVTALFNDTPCISTFMGKTRSSQSFTAELKDFTEPTRFNVCSAYITIAPDDVNEIGQDHTFTVTANKKVGSVVLPADDGTIVTVNLNDTFNAESVVSSDTCASGTIDGTCDITFSSATTGIVTGHASAEINVGGFLIFVETDGTGNNSGDAVKRFIDAAISISPDDINSIGEEHTFTINTFLDNGDGTGFVGVEDGTIVTVILTDTEGAESVVSSDTCASGTIDGTCDITFTSNTAGTVVGHAFVTLNVDGVALIRETDGTGNNSGDATKQFIGGSLFWNKIDNAGQPQGEATFEVCRTHNFKTDSFEFEPISPVCITVTDDTDGVEGPGPDWDSDAGDLLLTDLVLGRYTVEETVAPVGFVIDPKIETVDITLDSPDAVIIEVFQDERPIVKITEFGYKNVPIGIPTHGIVSGNASYTIALKNFGGADALNDVLLTISAPGGVGNGSLQYIGSIGPAGIIEPIAGSDCTTGCDISLADAELTIGEELIIEVMVVYDNVADETIINAELTSDYTTTTDDFERAASGSPAIISFTTQID